MWFCAASGFEDWKTSQTSINALLRSVFSADLNEQWSRLDKIRIFEVEEIKDEDVNERVVEVANFIG